MHSYNELPVGRHRRKGKHYAPNLLSRLAAKNKFSHISQLLKQSAITTMVVAILLLFSLNSHDLAKTQLRDDHLAYNPESLSKVAARITRSESRSDSKKQRSALIARIRNKAIAVSRGETRQRMVILKNKDPESSAWINRLDNYLAGSPMSNLGKVFYQSAKEQGLDPRLSLAIAKLESNLGRNIPGGYNAFGMVAGSVPGRGRVGRWQAFLSWEDAIRSNNQFIRKHWGTSANPFNMRGYASSSSWAIRVNAIISSIGHP